VCVMFIFKHRV